MYSESSIGRTLYTRGTFQSLFVKTNVVGDSDIFDTALNAAPVQPRRHRHRQMGVHNGGSAKTPITAQA